MNRDKKVLLTFIVAMLGAIVFAGAQNLFYQFWNFQFWEPDGFLFWQNIFVNGSEHYLKSRPLAFLGTYQFASEMLGLLCAGLFTSCPIYLGIRKFIWKR